MGHPIRKITLPSSMPHPGNSAVSLVSKKSVVNACDRYCSLDKKLAMKVFINWSDDRNKDSAEKPLHSPFDELRANGGVIKSLMYFRSC